MEDAIVKAALDVLTPVLESAVIVAAEYVKCCGRNVITVKDTEYSLKYCARNVLGKHVGTMFPELQGSDSDSDVSDVEEVPDDECPFTRYSGPSTQFTDDVHRAVDTWDEWVPVTPTEILLKSAVDKTSL